MRVEILVEELSAKAALQVLLPQLLPVGCSFRFIVFNGCHDLLGQLRRVLNGYANRIYRQGEQDLRVIVLVDADTKGVDRKKLLEAEAAAAGLVTKTTAGAEAHFYVLNRIAVNELEAWLLGDRAAIQAAYPRIHPPHFKGMARNPDTMVKSSFELLHLLQKGGYFTAGKQKQKWAADIAAKMNVYQNESTSFQHFCTGLAALR
jgi:hypothetical protein